MTQGSFAALWNKSRSAFLLLFWAIFQFERLEKWPGFCGFFLWSPSLGLFAKLRITTQGCRRFEPVCVLRISTRQKWGITFSFQGIRRPKTRQVFYATSSQIFHAFQENSQNFNSLVNQASLYEMLLEIVGVLWRSARIFQGPGEDRA